MFYKWILLACATVIFTAPLLARPIEVRRLPPETDSDQRNHYFGALLEMALEKTVDSHGPYRIEIIQTRMGQSRAIQYLERNEKIDVLWSMTSKEREAKLRAVRIPLLRGLLGHRVFIVHQDDVNQFAQVQSLTDLMAFAAGQGHDWPDTQILRANGLRVTASPTYEGLFKMLVKHRFDYFPRGVNEVFAELEQHSDLPLAVEPNLVLWYPAPIYFFVTSKHQRLATRLEAGLRAGIKDGGFDEIFYNSESQKTMFAQAKLENRRVIALKNPLLPEETPLEENQLWFDLEAYRLKKLAEQSESNQTRTELETQNGVENSVSPNAGTVNK